MATARRVLVVEDDARLANALRRGLAAEGYHVETAADGEVGLARTSEDAFDLVVLNLTLPGLGGFEVLTVGDLRMDRTTRVVTRAGRQVELTQREFDVFEPLLRCRGRLVGQTELVEAVWHVDVATSPNIADVSVGYLRKKLGASTQPPLIRTVRGRGFVLEAP